MSFSIQRAVSDGTLALLPISIEYFNREEISVLFNGVVNALPWSWVGVNDATISFTPPIPNMVEVSILRSTDLSALRHSFSMGAQFTATSLDESLLQILHIAQESKEGSGLGEVYQNLNFHGFKATNMGNGSLPGDAVNHAQMEVHDATIVGYKNAAQASAVEAAASAASINPVQFPTPTAADVIPMTNPAGNGWLYKTITQLKTLLGLGSAAYTDSTAYQAADVDIPTVLATQAEMEAGTEVAVRSMSPLRVKQAILALISGMFGVGQTWQNMIGSRVSGTAYTNSTGKPITVICGQSGSGAATTLTVTVGGVSFGGQSTTSGGTIILTFVVPNGATYSATLGVPFTIWMELR